MNDATVRRRILACIVTAGDRAEPASTLFFSHPSKSRVARDIKRRARMHA